MKVSLPLVRLSAVTASLPARSQSMAEMAQHFGELEVRRIVHSTGVEAVRVAGELTSGDLCLAAARHLLALSGSTPKNNKTKKKNTQTPNKQKPKNGVQL